MRIGVECFEVDHCAVHDVDQVVPRFDGCGTVAVEEGCEVREFSVVPDCSKEGANESRLHRRFATRYGDARDERRNGPDLLDEIGNGDGASERRAVNGADVDADVA